MKSLLASSAVVLGVVLLAASFLWAVLFPASRGWTDEKSAQLTELGNQATDIQRQLLQAQSRPRMHSGENPAELQEKYDQVAAEYKALHEEFVGKSEAPDRASTILRWSGVAFVVAGGLVVFASRGG